MDEAQLVQQWLDGNHAAFALLVESWQQPIARFLFRLTGDAELTQDLAQEVFLRVHQARESYQEQGTFSAWLYRIALNVARDSARRRKSTVPLTESEQPAQRHEPGREELQSLVASIISGLPESLRMVIALRLDEGMSFEEIARQTGTAASTWKSRFSKAMNVLRQQLRQRGYGPEETTG